MTANEAPEKIYVDNPNHDFWYRTKAENSIEYTRTDAFIEKTCEWIRELNNHYYIMRYSDCCEPPLSEVTEWFKNYMKGEWV